MCFFLHRGSNNSNFFPFCCIKKVPADPSDIPKPVDHLDDGRKKAPDVQHMEVSSVLFFTELKNV